MHFQQAESTGPAVDSSEQKTLKQFAHKSSNLPFGQHVSLSSIAGPTYLTAQTLVQQVAYALSDKIFTYSPDTYDLDVALKEWQHKAEANAWGYKTGVSSLETRTGAGNLALGYVFSKDFDLAKRHIPQAIVASSSSLNQLRPALDQLSLLYSVANPFVAHVAAVDYAANSSTGLVTDYSTAFNLAEELGLGLVSSASAYEIQHMALFSTLLASIIPAIHTYDGITVGRETTRVVDALDKSGLKNNYDAILKAVSNVEGKHSDNEGRLVRLLKAFNDELGFDYKLFEYHGHEAAETVFVVFGTVEASLARQVADALAAKGSKIGVLNVRVYRPFVEELFVEAIPQTARTVAVLGQVHDAAAVADETAHSALYSDVLATLSFSSNSASSVVDLKYPREEVWTPSKFAELFAKFNSEIDTTAVSLEDPTAQQLTFWNVDDAPAIGAPIALGQLFSKDSATNVLIRTGHDNLVQGGVVRTDLRKSNKSIEAAYSVSAADFAFVGDEKLLNEFDIVNNLKTGGTLLVSLPGVKKEDLEKRIPVGARKAIFAKNLDLFVLDSTAAPSVQEEATLEAYLVELATLKILEPTKFDAAVEKLATLSGGSLETFVKDVETAVRPIQVPESWATVEPEVESISLPTDINVNSFSSFERVDPEPPTLLKNWVTAAKGLAFKEAYGTKSALRPDLPVKTSIVHVKEHRRLTPPDYDRNIFHIEFDLGDSGVKYEIGEALGVHAENDPKMVEEFIQWYGLNADEIVEVPTREDANVLENRTIFQALIQNVDIFGRPPKRFYEALAEFASEEKDKQSLLTLATPDGAAEFKRRAEVDTITYADVLLEFKSAHPSFHDIVRIVSPMKRREYSIASSQKVTPNSVSLLIVTVNWVDSHGRDRFGQATRYLNSLPVGAPVTVSVKPSVMKLPPKTTAPIIMAGLGTGLAPFRAFVQERARQKQAGEPIGSVLLYMGARHQREEYLYGEEWEAYQDAGIITLLGRAFSRDQPEKIYIQDRMRQSMAEIRKAYLEEEGSFYLCGPTWPVPDVTAVLQEAVELESELRHPGKKVDSRRVIEEMKEDGRYVLEVY
ncbi:sulfite reductase flavoprotein component [Phyllosticta citrichinensis]|uniref:Sulfite reductase flavoprotein component n=1 Tax=Phyllosticta citrichinensis TaxID=1130410 RepID=A0ABR1XFQ9_9PEZI